MIDELYIDGQRADLSGTDIYLDYKSQMLADIKTLVASHSFSIKLPKTANNLRLIDCSHVPTSASRFAYTKHKATLLRDGICLLDGVDVVLLSVSSTIDISLLWNIFPKMQNLQNINLNEMPYEEDNSEENLEFVHWYGSPVDGNDIRSKDSRFPQMELGQLWRNNYRHPVISLAEIMQKIARYYKVVINLPNGVRARMENMVVPVLNRSVSPTFTKPFTLLATGNIIARNNTMAYIGAENNWHMEGMNWSYYIRQSSETIVSVLRYPFINEAWGVTYKLHITGSLKQTQFVDASTFARYCPEEIFIRIQSKNIAHDAEGKGNYGDEIEETYVAMYRTEMADSYATYVVDEKCELPAMNTDSIFAFSISEKNDGKSPSFQTFTSRSELNFEFTPDVAQLEPLYSNTTLPISLVNYYYYLVPNLPKVKVVDFIKSVAQLFGLFIYEQNGEIMFQPYKLLETNKSKARDWSQYYLSSSVDTLEYVVNESLTKRNVFCFANASDYPETSAVIEIDNEQLSSEENNLVESKFAAASNASIGGAASIPLYEYNYDWDGKKQSLYEKWKYSKDSKMYLLERVKNGDFYTAKFTTDWKKITEEYWQTYIGMIKEGRLVTCTLLISPFELRTLDMSVPVYIKQLGAYFAVQEIKTKANNQAEVKLIKL